MKIFRWVAISGSRDANRDVEQLVRQAVRDILASGGGIVTGGALGVDYFATDEALNINPKANTLRVYLPTSLETYGTHYRRRATEGVITSAGVEALISQLERVKQVNPKALIENFQETVVDQRTYFQRHADILDNATELLAFQVNKSPGTQDTIDKARSLGMAVKIYEF